MANLRDLLRFGDRRKEDRRVPTDRRAPSGKEVKDRLRSAHERLTDFARRHTSGSKFVAINDRQQVVIFSTYRDICPNKGPEIGSLRLCRHSGHADAANSELAICDEEKCPRITAALSAA